MAAKFTRATYARPMCSLTSSRNPEIDALVGAVIKLGRDAGVPTPHIEAVYALVRLLARTVKEEKVYIRAERVAA